MAHYAQINSNNIVINVIVGKDEGGGIDWELYYTNTMGRENNTRFLRTSYNTRSNMHLLGGIPFRKNYAGIGYTYDDKRDAFIPPKPSPSFILNEETCVWEPPIPPPTDLFDQYNKIKYLWDESSKSWKLI